MPFLLAAMPLVADPARIGRRRATVAIGLRGGPRYGVSFADGAVTVHQQAPKWPHCFGACWCTVVCEPLTFFLLALGRRTLAQALVPGRTLAWGRRPWLALRFPGFFRAP
jgi:hypothetical protein